MKRILILFVAAICIQHVSAQKGGSFTMSYPIALPMGDLGDYISNTSFRGFNMEFNKRQKSNLDIGIEVGWNVFYERQDDQIYTKETTSISGVQYRYTNAVPLLAGAKLYKETSSNLAPFVGLGLGTTYLDRSTDFGLYRITTTTWQFCLRPEIGLVYEGKSGASGFAAIKYYNSFGSNDLDGQSFISLNLGIMFSSF